MCRIFLLPCPVLFCSVLPWLAQFVCTFLVTVSDPDTFVLMPNVNVTGRFTTTKAYTGWPATRSALTNVNGVATIKSPAVATATVSRVLWRGLT